MTDLAASVVVRVATGDVYVVVPGELAASVVVSVADPYPLPRLSCVVPAAHLEVYVTVRVAA